MIAFVLVTTLVIAYCIDPVNFIVHSKCRLSKHMVFMVNKMIQRGHYRTGLFYIFLAKKWIVSEPILTYLHALIRYRMEDYAKASELFMVAKGRYPSYTALDHVIGDTLIRMDHIDRAKPFLDRYLLSNPHHTMARLNLALADYRTGHFENALRLINGVIDMDPNQLQAYKLRGFVLVSLNRFDEALDDFQYYNGLGARDSSVNTQILKLLRHLHRYKECSQVASELIEKGQDEPEIYVHYGDALFHLGSIRQGLLMLNQAVRLDDNQHEAHYLIAKLMALTHHKSEALEHLKKAVVQHPLYSKLASEDEDFNNLRFFRDFYRLID